jgi:hypothetical protein
MAAFSDTVRPGIHLSSLGQPDVRLHLPKHHAVASWTTPQGRQAPFIARTIPLRIDRDRIALHAARQSERGGRHCTDLRQPHWDSPSRGDASDAHGLAPRGATATASASEHPAETLPAIAAETYRELVELDGAQSVRWARKAGDTRALEPEELDLEILALVATLKHVLTSQIHRRFNPSRSITTTQRRLKRLSDAGLVERFQFHRPDGGGVPMCYVITPEGLGLVRTDQQRALEGEAEEPTIGASLPTPSTEGGRRLRQARRDVHVAGWVLALERLCSPARCALRGLDDSVLSPPMRSSGDRRIRLSPADLRLPAGRTPHDFLRTEAGGEAVEVEYFETVRPNAIMELPGERRGGASDVGDTGAARPLAIDVLVEFDDRLPPGAPTSKLERYDHFLTGWIVHTRRYGRRGDAVPLLVFVCRDRSRAREFARRADPVLRACRAYAGEYPFDWDYPARESILFASERDVHEGLSCAYGVPRLPPDVRASAADGDGRAREAVAEPKDIISLMRRVGE